MAEIDKLIIKVELDTTEFKKSLNNINESFKKFNESSNKAFDNVFSKKKTENNAKKVEAIIGSSVKNISNIISKGLVGAGTVYGTKFAIDFMRGITQKGLNTQFLSQAFNVNTSKLQTVQQLFKLVGGSAESANAAIAQLYNRLNSPSDPSLSKGLKLLNVRTFENGQQKDAATLLIDAINNASKVPERQRNTALQFLGLPPEAQALANNPKMIRNLLKKINQNEGIISPDEINKQAEIEVKFQLLGQRWERITATILDKLLPGIERFTTGIEAILHPTKTLQTLSFDKNTYKGVQSKFSPKDMIRIDNFDKLRKKIDVENSFEKYKKPLSIQESSGGKNLQDRMFFNNDSRRGFGEYQITKAAFKEVMGHYPNPKELKTPTVLEEAAKRYWNYGYMLSNKDPIGARAFYNGGYNGLKNYQRTGFGTNPSDQIKWQENLKKYVPNPAQIMPQHNTTTNHQQNLSMSIGNISMPNVTNPGQFTKELHKMALTGYGFSGNLLA